MFLYFYFKNQKQQLQKLDLQLQKEKAELNHKALFLQMNPHFIFNCLGSVSSLILQEENKLATQYLNKFARLLRLTLENSKEDTITIANEIENLEQYIALEKLRFENSFDHQITYSFAGMLEEKIPSMLLQPLVENAILHGVSNIKIPGKINIDFSVLENQLKITIQDNGIGYENSKKQKANSVLQHQSMAMEIIQKRIETIGGTFKITQTQLDKTYPGTQIILQLNYIK
jgi:LytS/YehU family sensor histidine kinase